MQTIITCPKCRAKNRVDPSRATQAVCGRCHAPLETAAAADHPITLTDQTFAAALANAGDTPILVDCWAAWCGPCRMLAPTLDQLATESSGRYIIAKLNVDENPQTAGRFNVSSIPAMLIFKRGQLVNTLVGLQPKQAIAAQLAKVG
jgi:thioredoxin 2